MKIRVIPQLNGNFYVGDAEDEDAPLLKVEFCNEAARLTEENKLRLARTIMLAFADRFNEQAKARATKLKGCLG